MSEEPFSRRAIRWLVGICVVSFLGAVLLAVFAHDLVPIRSTGADSYSWSALGHRAFVSVLQELDIPAVSSRFSSATRVGGGGVLVVADPPQFGRELQDGVEQVAALVGAADQTLLVLPKWSPGTARRTERGWVTSVRPVTDDRIVALLAALDIEADVHRTEERVTWTRRAFPAPSFPTALTQVITTTDIEPLLTCDEGMLIGERTEGDRRLIVLADPDLLCNAGLHLGQNAQIVVAAIERLREEGAAVVIDETIHGYERSPSIWRELFSYPLLLVLLHVALLIVVLLWAGLGRFGAPAPAPPPLEPGQRFLIRSTAGLLRHAGQTRAVLARYLENAVREAQTALRAPSGLTRAELDAWLDRAAEVRGTRDRHPALRRAVGALPSQGARGRQTLALATRVHDWRQEIVHGRPGRT